MLSLVTRKAFLYTGIVLSTVGIVIFGLGRFYYIEVLRTPINKPFTRSGIYKRLRFPEEFGLLLFALGICLACCAPCSFFVFCHYFYTTVADSVKIREIKLGQKYATSNYTKEAKLVPCYIPFY